MIVSRKIAVCDTYPRNDMVLVESVKADQSSSGVLLPDTSLESSRFVVRAMGNKVNDLDVGDFVEIMGKVGEDVVPLPARYEGKLFITRQDNILLRVKG